MIFCFHTHSGALNTKQAKDDSQTLIYFVHTLRSLVENAWKALRKLQIDHRLSFHSNFLELEVKALVSFHELKLVLKVSGKFTGRRKDKLWLLISSSRPSPAKKLVNFEGLANVDIQLHAACPEIFTLTNLPILTFEY